MKLSAENISRFWFYVEKREPNECWPWKGTKTHGYGEMSCDYVKQKAHRISFFLHNGEIPNDNIVMHTCDNTACCNPFHLKLGTPWHNSQDMVNKGRSKKGGKHWAAMFTDEEIRAIRKDTRSQREIARSYFTTQSRVSLIKSRKAWGHVPDKVDSD